MDQTIQPNDPISGEQHPKPGSRKLSNGNSITTTDKSSRDEVTEENLVQATDGCTDVPDRRQEAATSGQNEISDGHPTAGKLGRNTSNGAKSVTVNEN